MSLSRFPKVELSYDKTLHKKIHADLHADLYSVVPKGERAWLWFTYTGSKNACFIVDSKRQRVSAPYTACFADDLALGTIMSGVIFKFKKRLHFACDDIQYYEGNYIGNATLQQRIYTLGKLFGTQFRQISYGISLHIGLTVMTTNHTDSLHHAKNASYAVYGIRHRRQNGTSLGIQVLRDDIAPEGIFRVSADIQDDIYHLSYTGDCGNPLTASVPSYNRSVSLNAIFRNIKENRNLDALEESDDENDFEDVRKDKYVNLEKHVLMKCIFHKRFRKWEPVEIVDRRSKLIHAKNILV